MAKYSKLSLTGKSMKNSIASVTLVIECQWGWIWKIKKQAGIVMKEYRRVNNLISL